MMAMNRQWLYARQPQGKIGKDTFEWRETAIPQPREGEALVPPEPMLQGGAGEGLLAGEAALRQAVGAVEGVEEGGPLRPGAARGGRRAVGASRIGSGHGSAPG